MSSTLAVEELRAALRLEPDEVQRKGDPLPGLRVPRPAREHSWAITAAGDRSVPLQSHVDAVLKRALPHERDLAALRDRGCVLVLSLMQWIAEDDPAGPGFGLDAAQVRLLAAIGAFVDVDQYRD